ncbi:MAG: hypothetical protein ACLFNK_01940 [Candidatus Woesearchaeota archaeon]
MSRKAQGLSMSTIVVAALALLVLSILSLLFIGRMNVARDDINDCQANGGICVDTESYYDCRDALDEHPTYSRRYSATREVQHSCYESHGENYVCCMFS